MLFAKFSKKSGASEEKTDKDRKESSLNESTQDKLESDDIFKSNERPSIVPLESKEIKGIGTFFKKIHILNFK